MSERTPTAVETDFHERMHAAQMYGLWELASQMTRHPQPRAVAHMWKAALLDRMVREASEVVPVGEERRALQLFNPGLGGQWATTNTMIAAVQILLPGETARAHRHSPTAIRFIMEGDGAYTAVDGERVYMAPGDLVLTPSWAWHDHGNETDHLVVWMDGLDVPLVSSVNAMFFQMYEDAREFPLTKPHNASARLHGHANLRPTWVSARPQSSPLLLYAWEATWRSLSALRDTAGDPFDGIALEYTHPQTGGPVLPTMACRIQMLRPDERLRAHRHTGSAVYYVAQGTGETIIDGVRFPWEKGDIITLPSWALHEHGNRSSREAAVLFSIQDRPVLEALGLYREEALAGGDGHQKITATFSGAAADTGR
jgi:gentisate 1,2-dioxygenase